MNRREKAWLAPRRTRVCVLVMCARPFLSPALCFVAETPPSESWLRPCVNTRAFPPPPFRVHMSVYGSRVKRGSLKFKGHRKLRGSDLESCRQNDTIEGLAIGMTMSWIFR